MEAEVRAVLEQIERRLAGLEEKINPSLPLVLTREHSATLLSIGLSTLKKMQRRGQFVPVWVGNRWMVPASEVIRMATPGSRLPRRIEEGPKRAPRARAKTEVEKMRQQLKDGRKKKS